MTNAMQINGLEQLQKLMAELPDKVQRQVAVAGVRIAGSRLRTLMRRRVPVRSSKLRKAIGLKYGKGRDVAKVTVGLLSRFYYKTLEQGRKPYKRKSTKGIYYTVSGTPNMDSQGLGLEDVWNTHKDELLKVLIEGMQKELYRQLGRASVTGKFRR